MTLTDLKDDFSYVIWKWVYPILFRSVIETPGDVTDSGITDEAAMYSSVAYIFKRLTLL